MQVVIEDIKEMLENGKTRKEIAEHYDLPLSVLRKQVFSHPELKGKKTKKVYDIKVVHSEEVSETEESPAEEDSSELSSLAQQEVEEQSLQEDLEEEWNN